MIWNNLFRDKSFLSIYSTFFNMTEVGEYMTTCEDQNHDRCGGLLSEISNYSSTMKCLYLSVYTYKILKVISQQYVSLVLGGIAFS